MDIEAARSAEHQKYRRTYSAQPKYRMGPARMSDAIGDLSALPCRGSYLDVSCGRGEMVRAALRIGFASAIGTEIVPELIDGETVFAAEVHALPFADKSFDVASMFDVIEHLIPGDDEAACRELARVASRHILISANNRPSFSKAGDDLHINKRPYDQWDEMFRSIFPGKVTWIKDGHQYVSETWRVDL